MTCEIINSIITINNRCMTQKEINWKKSDLSRRETSVLLSIDSSEHISGNELAERNHLSPSRLSRIIDKMCQKGYIQRTMSDNDRRSVELSLTNRGIKTRQEFININKKCENQIRNNLSKTELKLVQEALTILLLKTRGTYEK